MSALAELYRYAGTGQVLAIRWHVDEAGAKFAVIDCDPDGEHPAAFLPPQEVPKAARALYKAAGLGVPDLPDLPDPGLVESLAADVHRAVQGDDGAAPYPVDRRVAASLLAHGWGRTP